jgi:MFS family permease
LGMLALAMAPPFPVALLVMFVMGLGSGPLNPVLMSVRQERVPLEVRARVFGTTTAICMVAIPLGQVAGGFAVEQFGPERCIGFIALVYLGMVLSFLLNPVLREMDARRHVVGRSSLPTT